MLHYQNLVTLCLLSVLDKHAPKKKKRKKERKEKEKYMFKQLEFYD